MTLFTELRQAVRALLRAPSFSAISVLTLALAIGGNTAIYSALRTLVLRPLPFADGDRLVYLWHENPKVGGVLRAPSIAAIDEWRSASVFEQIERYAGREVELTGAGEPTRISMTALEPTTLPMLGVTPMLGRGLVEGDFDPAAAPVVLISHAIWQARFGGDPAAIGAAVILDDVPHLVVGVMPPGFRLPMGSDALWAPAKQPDRPESSRNALAKLRRGATVADAQSALAAMAAAGNDPDRKGWRGVAMSPRDYNGAPVLRTLWTLTAAVGLLFVIGCVNVANLMLSRNSDRTREVALRQAIGASRLQVLRYLLIECGVLAIVGGAFGLLLAQWLVAGMIWIKPRNLDVLGRVAIDPHVIGVAAAISMLTAIVFGLWPSLRGSRLAVQQLVSPTSRTTTAEGLQQRQVLTALQVGVALVLLVGAALLVRSFARLTAVEPGFDPAGLVAMRVSLPPSRYGDADPQTAAARRSQFFDRVLEQVQTVPGVSAAAIGSGLPSEAGVLFGALEIEGRPPGATSRGSSVFAGGSVTPGYFATLRIPIVEGRPFTNEDVNAADPVAIVGQAFAREYFHSTSPIGARIRLSPADPFARIVGVVSDVRATDFTEAAGRPQLYYPRAQTRPATGTVIVRTDSAIAPMVQKLKASVWAIDPRLPIADVFTASEARGRSQSHARFSMLLLAAFACCGLGLAAIGVYGVMALYVGQRYRELGVRVALGATRAAVTKLVLRQMVTPLAIGIAGGIVAASVLAHQLTPLLFATPPGDALAYIAAITVVLSAAVVAAAVPWRRATTIDSALVLRGE